MKGWLEQKKSELYAVLSQGFIMYGEWLQIRHTVSYDTLPDWFIAFDLYSVREQRFLSTAARDQILAQHAPSLARIQEVEANGRPAASRQELLHILRNTKSAYRSDGGKPEGLYIRVENGGFLQMRAKLVDPEFKQAIEADGHWMHKARELNTVRTDLWGQVDETEAECEDESNSHVVDGFLAIAQEKGRKGDYPSALEHALRALNAAEAMSPTARLAKIVRAHFLEAQALFGMGSYERARGSFTACLSVIGDEYCADFDGIRDKCGKGLVQCDKVLEKENIKMKLNNPRERVNVKTTFGNVCLMRNTSWLVDSQVLSGSTPKNQEHIRALYEACQISLVVTLTDTNIHIRTLAWPEEEPLKKEWFTNGKIRNLFVPVPNYCPPSMDQAKHILNMMEREIASGGRVFVHCGGGKGRAGTVNACWMVKHGLERYAQSSFEGTPKMCGEEALRVLRDMRPGSIETERQEKFVSDFCTEMWRLYDASAAPPAAADVTGAAATTVEDAHSFSSPAHVPPYPRTPHLDFSPQVAQDDVTVLPEQAQEAFTRTPVIVTEKLDGGNCCIFEGRVFARTHGHEATAAWFSAAKEKAAELKILSLVPPHVALFLENMQAIHSINYGVLSSPLWVICALDVRSDKVLNWEETERIALGAGLPTVPVLFKGEFESRDHLQFWMKDEIKKGSYVGGGAAPKEGFVVRVKGEFQRENFLKSCAKYVRRGHVQTNANFRQNWKQATWLDTTWEDISHGSREAAAATFGNRLAYNSDGEADRSSNVECLDSSPTFDGDNVKIQHVQACADSKTGAAAGSAAACTKHTDGKKAKQGLNSRTRTRCTGPKFVMLVGMPGSGKSTFWNLLKEGMKDGADVYVRVSQDELGSRGACEDAVGRILLGGRTTGQGVVLDRCNCAAADRASWLGISMQSSKQCVCVFFDFDQDTCTKRVAARRDHPTIPFGHGARAVASHAKLLEKPKAEEGFSKVYRVTCEEDARRAAAAIMMRS